MKGIGIVGVVLAVCLVIGVLADARTGRPVTFDNADLSTAAAALVCLAIGAVGVMRDR